MGNYTGGVLLVKFEAHDGLLLRKAPGNPRRDTLTACGRLRLDKIRAMIL